MRRLALPYLAFALAVPLFAQAPPKKSAFEVVSVKPSAPAGGPLTIGARGGRFTATNAPVKLIIQLAYQPANGAGMLPDQVIGGANWITTDRYDIEGKPAGDTRAMLLPQMWPMVQSLLEVRFNLKAHPETRELPVYNLVVAKGGPKIKLSADQTPLPTNPDASPLNPNAPALPATPPTPRSNAGGSQTLRGTTQVNSSPSAAGAVITVSGTAIPIEQLRRSLQSYAGRTVIDKTGLRGLFDVRLQFTQQPLSADPGGAPGGASLTEAPTLFTAVEQLGLKLESAKGPVYVLVIDSIDKPSMN